MELERLDEDARACLSPAFNTPRLGQFNGIAATDGIALQPSDQVIGLAGAGQAGSVSRQNFVLILQLQ